MKKTIRRRQVTDTETPFNGGVVSPLLERVYRTRGVSEARFLEYSLQFLHKPERLKGIGDAANLLVEALHSQKRVCIVGDFDADGATSTSLCVLCLRAMGFQHVDFIVPNRFEFGYGLSPEIVEVVAQRQPQLLITVDNGISSIEGVAAAKAHGMQVLVTDHHLAGATLPDADAIVNPNQPGCDFPSKALAGVGVIFYVMNALRAALRKQNWFVENNHPEPNMASFLDLVALGTVADVVPLDFNNRILVDQGMKRMRAGQCLPGIRALLEVGGRNLERLTTSDLGFAVGPRLNAAGRLDDMSIGIRCLLSSSYHEAIQLARELDDLNHERKAIEHGMRTEAFSILEKLGLDDHALPYGVSLFKEDWHQGVIGILASRIKDKLHRPTIVFARGEEGVVKGSGRSIPGIHLRDALDEVATSNPGLLTKFGGHAMAAGLSLAEDDLPVFQKSFNEVVKKLCDKEQLEAVIWTDGSLQQEQISLETAFELRNGGPWGQHFPEPVFDGRFCVVQQRIVGGSHLKLVLTPDERSGFLIDAIAFNCDMDVWPNQDIQYVNVVFKLDVNEFRGQQSAQLMVDYIEPVADARVDVSLEPA